MEKTKKDKKKWSLYKKSITIFSLIMLVAGVYALIYISSVLKDYEKGDASSFMNSLVKEITDDAKKGKISKHIKLTNVKNDYEKKPDLGEGYKALFNDAKITYKKADKKLNYDIFADGKKIMTVKLKDLGEKHALGLLVYNELEVDSIKTYDEDGLYSVNIEVADKYDLYINDTKVDKKEIKSTGLIPQYSEIYEMNIVELPKLNHYEITGLTFEPKVEVKDSKGNKIDITKEGDKLYAADFKTYPTLEKAGSNIKDNFNPIKFAEDWSKFLTMDLGDANLYGFGDLANNLIKGTALYQRGYSWATQVDITFTSMHDLKSMTGQKVSNITVYNENAFSAEVYVEKNMHIHANATVAAFDKTDKFHEMMYFVYYDGAYRVVNMQTITE